MNNKKIQSYLSMSIVIGFFIDFILTLIINTQSKEIYNYLVTGLCSIIPFILFSIYTNIKLYKYGKIELKKSIIIGIIYLIISFVFGFIIEWLIINNLLKKDINNIVRMANALYQSTIGILVSVNYSYDYYKRLIK